MDGGLIVQWSQVPMQITEADLKPATAFREGSMYRCRREVPRDDRDEMVFAWKVVGAMSSNAVVFVKNGATVGIGNGQQDSLTAVEVARDKAYRKLADHIALKRFSKLYTAIDDRQMAESIMADVTELRGGLIGSIMASDAFLPTPDGVRVAANEGTAGIIQPGGSVNDHLVIQTCNETGIPMVFTGHRSFIG
jgi:phosphoribosylaminoimidazolecarboxamide formyltransferase/IMP cyclohydrolase